MSITIGIIGLGTMGIGIVQVALQNGCTVIAFDSYDKAFNTAQARLQQTFDKLVQKSKITQAQASDYLNKLVVSQNLNDLQPCTLIIEAIVEDLTVKQQLIQQLETVVSEQCIIATNTSSLSVTAIAAASKIPTRVCGIHFFNPAPLMALVEVVPALQTSDAILQQAITIITSWGKTGVVAKDTPGFIVNRIARPYYSEAIRIHEEGTPIEIIDMAMEAIGFKMGPFTLMDMIGHDVNYVVTETVWRSMYFDTRYTPSATQKRLLEAGWLGKKSGRGFYNYAADAPTYLYDPIPEALHQIQTRILLMLFNEAGNAQYLQIANEQDIETAMTKGVNYPKGLLAWAKEYGHELIVKQLDILYNFYKEDRYRCSAYFKQPLSL
jgi:3-hydroxybutyryl-CoA dehydrogenase